MLAAEKAKPLPSFVYRPSPRQIELHENKARFRVVCAGRRSGKTHASIQELVEYCYRNKNRKCWWCSFNYEKAELGLRKFLELFPKGSAEYEKRISRIVNKQPKRLEFHNGSSIEFRSSDELKKLVGEGLDFLVVDEAAWVADEVWHLALRPTLIDRKGRAIIISTPDRKNWFYDLWQKGHDPEQKNYAAFHWTTYDNPYLPDIEEEINDIKRELTQEDYENQVEAVFKEAGSAVFGGLGDCLWKPRDFKQKGERYWIEDKAARGKEHNYTIGVDVARSGSKRADYTVITVTRYTEYRHKHCKKVVYVERMKEPSLVIQGQKVWSVWKAFGCPPVYIDATAIGAALVDELSRNPNSIPTHKINPITFNIKSKQEIVGRLRLDIEHCRILIPEQMTILIDELSTYSMTFNAKTGHVKYGAAGNKKDDCVVSLALATMKDKPTKIRYMNRLGRIKAGW